MLNVKSSHLSIYKELENKQVETTQRIDELLRQLSEANELKNKFASQSAEVSRKNAALEFEFQQMHVAVKRSGQELDDCRIQLENEIMVSKWEFILFKKQLN